MQPQSDRGDLWSVAAERARDRKCSHLDAPGAGFGGDRLELRKGCHAGRPAGVEGQVGEGLGEFVLGEAVGQGQAQVADELVGPVGCGQDGDRDQAAVAAGQAGALPDVPEQDVVGELDYLGREVAEQPLGGSLLFFLFSLRTNICAGHLQHGQGRPLA